MSQISCCRFGIDSQKNRILQQNRHCENTDEPKAITTERRKEINHVWQSAASQPTKGTQNQKLPIQLNQILTQSEVPSVRSKFQSTTDKSPQEIRGQTLKDTLRVRSDDGILLSRAAVAHLPLFLPLLPAAQLMVFFYLYQG